MFEIIPAIDLIDGKCVRLSQGDFTKKIIYSEYPLETALKFAEADLKRLHIVDLDGAKSGKVQNLKALEDIADNTELIIDFSGGIKTDEDIRSVFDAGASMAGIGSMAVKRPEIIIKWLEEYGSSKILLGADVREGKLAIDGWQTDTVLEIFSYLKGWSERGVYQAFVTDICKDGLLLGSSNELYRQIIERIPGLNLIASGGVSKLSDICELKELGCAGVIVGKAIYEGHISLEELKNVSQKNNSMS